MHTRHHFRFAAFGAALLLFSCLTAPVVQAQQSGTIQFNFSGYGNPQRPFPGYVGPFQLGPVSISGSGEVRASDGALLRGGVIAHSDDLRDRRYPNHRTTWQVVKSLGVQSSGGVTVLRLQVRVVSSNYLDICPAGTRGIIELIDDNRRLSNGYSRDGIRTEMPNPASSNSRGGAACGTHTHGMNNEDYSWTDPPRGGAGIWANVEITGGKTSSLPRVLHVCEPICGTWTLQGNQYNAAWNNGARATITFEFFNDGRVVFYRRDTRDVGFTARYEGRITGNNQMKGTVRWTRANGQSENGTWSARW